MLILFDQCNQGPKHIIFIAKNLSLHKEARLKFDGNKKKDIDIDSDNLYDEPSKLLKINKTKTLINAYLQRS